jgi:hypothetical protein
MEERDELEDDVGLQKPRRWRGHEDGVYRSLPRPLYALEGSSAVLRFG